MAKTSRRAAAALVAALALIQGPSSDPASARRVPWIAEIAVCARVDVSGVPASCTDRPFTVDVRLPKYARFDTVELRLDGRLDRRSDKRHFKVTIKCGELARGKHRIEVTALPRSQSPWGVTTREFTALP